MTNLKAHKDAAMEFMERFYPDRKWWIVGGLLRDFALYRKAKDIDIFISGYETDLLPEGCDDLGDKNAFLLKAYTVKEYPYMGDHYEINLIFMRGDFWDLKQMTDRCDFGICQIGWEPDTDVTYRSDMYLRDIGRREITLARETTQERVNRMKDKFPSFDFCNPNKIVVDGKRSWAYNAETQELEVAFEKITPRSKHEPRPIAVTATKA